MPDRAIAAEKQKIVDSVFRHHRAQSFACTRYSEYRFAARSQPGAAASGQQRKRPSIKLCYLSGKQASESILRADCLIAQAGG